VALGETYVDGRWDTPDLNALLALFCRNEAALGSAAAGSWLSRLRRLAEHVANSNTKRGSRRNIAYHYDLGNDFYRLWLDPGMTYSAAVFAHDDEDLDAAQTRKYARLAAALDIAPEQRVLEIGCGWGAFAEFLAGTRGARVHGVSISRAQVEYAAQRIADAGLGDRARIELRDYRDLDGRYDRIVSVEMFEAVGERYWADYARVLRERLAPGGSAGLQVITIAPERFEGYRRRPDFIQRHVFPGGMLPSIPKLHEVMAGAGLAVTDEFRFGLDYALTLARWRERFETAWPAIAAQGFDARFRRLWRYYLAYCEVGFREGAIDVVQIRVEPR
jgi:cyclopropane-fatty-acyl-phospholipid synthase